MSQINPVHNLFLPLQFAPPIRLCIPHGLFHTCLPTKTLYTYLFYPVTSHMPHPLHPFSFDHSNTVWCGRAVINPLVTQFSPSSVYFPRLRSGIFVSNLFSINFSLCFSFNLRNLFHTHKKKRPLQKKQNNLTVHTCRRSLIFMQLQFVYSYNNIQYLVFIVILDQHSRQGDIFSIDRAVKTSHLNILFCNSGFRSARVSCKY